GRATSGGHDGTGSGVDDSRSTLRLGRSQRDWFLPYERSRPEYDSRALTSRDASGSESRFRYLEMDSPGRTSNDLFSVDLGTKLCSTAASLTGAVSRFGSSC